MIKTIAKLLGATPKSQIDALAHLVADESLESVCQLVSGHVESMTFSEARGYVRARAGRIVRKQARAAINRQPGAEEAWVDAIAHGATEQIVPLVLRQTGVGVPKATTKLRLAA